MSNENRYRCVKEDCDKTFSEIGEAIEHDQKNQHWITDMENEE